ncbi:MAG: hypothetical protein SNJ57_18615 [Cyanobacteriota bacterium]
MQSARNRSTAKSQRNQERIGLKLGTTLKDAHPCSLSLFSLMLLFDVAVDVAALYPLLFGKRSIWGERLSTVGGLELGDRQLAEGDWIADEWWTQRECGVESSVSAIGRHDEKGEYLGLNGNVVFNRKES